MAHSTELFHGSHDTSVFVEDEQIIDEATEQNEKPTDTVTSPLGAAAMSDIAREWGPARRRPDAPKYETPTPAELTWSA